MREAERMLNPEASQALEEAEIRAEQYGSNLLNQLLQLNRQRLRVQSEIGLLKLKALQMNQQLLSDFLETEENGLINEFNEANETIIFIEDPEIDLLIKSVEKSLVVFK